MNPLVLKIVLVAALMILWTYRVELLSFAGKMMSGDESASDGVSGPVEGTDETQPKVTPSLTKTPSTITMDQLLAISSEKPDLFMDLLPLALPEKVREVYEQNE